MPIRLRRAAPAALAVLALVPAIASCGGGDGGGDNPDPSAGREATEARDRLNGADKPRVADFPKPSDGQTLQAFADSVGATGTRLGLATSVYTPGENRVAFGLLGNDNRFIYAPTVVYAARGPNGRDIRGPYPAPADVLVTEVPFRSQQAATEEDPFAAVYQAAGVELDRPGRWALLAVSKVNGRDVAAPIAITVRRDAPIPDVGEPAPAVETDTVESAGSIEAIDTRRPTAPELHAQSFSDVVGEKPVALLFATPQLCQSRVCGPVVDIALQLRRRYGDQMEFIHQEVYVDNDIQKGLREPLQRFRLPTEPWLFTVDRQGRVAARLEGSFGLDAFDRAVRAAL